MTTDKLTPTHPLIQSLRQSGQAGAPSAHPPHDEPQCWREAQIEAPPRPRVLQDRGSHVTVLYHDNQGEENAGGSNLQGGSSPGRYRDGSWEENERA
ncbi:synaptopodin-2 [Lates japonicus]|uniref:Synaptopodin-2 n=1 Tax=Lates japonicus TaxID=270547 RepID=A0AAD3MYZ9_LATJO|nr:synaptopodin-2 [Lates japonicus]